MRNRLFPLKMLIAVPLAILLLTNCSGYGSARNRSERETSCGDVLESVVQRERAGDTAGTINSELDWLSSNCPSEYDVAIGYVSAKSSVELAGPDACATLTQYVGREAVALLSEDGLCEVDAAGLLAEAPVVESQPGGGIAWSEALGYAGTAQRVCGPLAGVGNSEDDVFLNLGLDYPDPGRFQIVLWDIGGVEPIPLGATLCTAGQITLYEGVAQIELELASLVEIYG